MESRASVEISLPIDEVFEYTTTRVPEWSLTVVEDEVIEEKPEGAGSTFRTVTEDRGRRMEFDGTVTCHEPPTLHAIRMVGKQFDIEAEYTFKDLGGRTRIALRSTVTGKGLTRAMFFLFGWLMGKSSCDAMDRELANLKRLMEERGSQSPS